MAELYLVRHGQASFGAEEYDALSSLGEAQSRWLGEHFAQKDVRFDRVIGGTLTRHRQTVEAIFRGMGSSAPGNGWEEHPGLDEYDFSALHNAYLARFPPPEAGDRDPRGFYRILKRALLAWSKDELPEGPPESWPAFRRRVREVLPFVQARIGAGQRVLAVTSGGPIAVLIGEVLALAPEKIVELNFQIRNTGLSHCFLNGQRIALAQFNATPHLERTDRFSAVTYG